MIQRPTNSKDEYSFSTTSDSSIAAERQRKTSQRKTKSPLGDVYQEEKPTKTITRDDEGLGITLAAPIHDYDDDGQLYLENTADFDLNFSTNSAPTNPLSRTAGVLTSFDSKIESMLKSRTNQNVQYQRIEPSTKDRKSVSNELSEAFDAKIKELQSQDMKTSDEAPLLKLLSYFTQIISGDLSLESVKNVFANTFSKSFPALSEAGISPDNFLSLVKVKLDSRLDSLAQEVTSSMSDNARENIFLTFITSDKGSSEFREAQAKINNLIEHKLDFEKVLLGVEFTNKLLVPSLVQKTRIALGADKQTFISHLSKTEDNFSKYNASQRILLNQLINKDKNKTQPLNKFPALQTFSGIKSIANIDNDTLTNSMSEILGSFSHYQDFSSSQDDFKYQVYIKALEAIEALAKEKVDQVFNSVSGDLLKDTSFIKALKDKNDDRLKQILSNYLPSNFLNNPVRSLLFANKIATDLQFQRAIDQVPSRARALTNDIRAKAALALLGVTGAAGLAANASWEVQDNRNPYTAQVKEIPDASVLDTTKIISEIEQKKSEIQSWNTRDVYTAQALIDAEEKGLLDFDNNKPKILLANQLKIAPQTRGIENIPMIQVDFNKGTSQVRDNLIRLIEANTNLLQNYDQKEKEKIIERFLEQRKVLISEYEPLRNEDCPAIFLPYTIGGNSLIFIDQKRLDYLFDTSLNESMRTKFANALPLSITAFSLNQSFTGDDKLPQPPFFPEGHTTLAKAGAYEGLTPLRINAIETLKSLRN